MVSALEWKLPGQSAEALKILVEVAKMHRGACLCACHRPTRVPPVANKDGWSPEPHIRTLRIIWCFR